MSFRFRKAEKELAEKIIGREAEFARSRVIVCAVMFVILLMLSLAMVSAIYIGDVNDRAAEILGYNPDRQMVSSTDEAGIARYSAYDEQSLALNDSAAQAAREQAKADLRGERAALYIGAVSASLLLAFAATLIATGRLRQFKNSVIYVCRGECVSTRVGYGRHGRYLVTVAADGDTVEFPVTGRTYSSAHPGCEIYVVSIDRSAWSVDGIYTADELDNRISGEDRLLDI